MSEIAIGGWIMIGLVALCILTSVNFKTKRNDNKKFSKNKKA